MTGKAKRPKREANVFDLSWEGDDDAEEAARAEDPEEPGDDDVESHGASGFNRPS